MPDLHYFCLVRPVICFVPMYLRLAGFAEARPRFSMMRPMLRSGPLTAASAGRS